MGLDTFIEFRLKTRDGSPIYYNDVIYTDFTFELGYFRKYYNLASMLDKFIATYFDNEWHCEFYPYQDDYIKELKDILTEEYYDIMYGEKEEEYWNVGDVLRKIDETMHNLKIFQAFLGGLLSFADMIHSLELMDSDYSYDDIADVIEKNSDLIDWDNIVVEVSNSY